MPIGVITNVIAVIVGGLLGGVLGRHLSVDFKTKLSISCRICLRSFSRSSLGPLSVLRSIWETGSMPADV